MFLFRGSNQDQEMPTDLIKTIWHFPTVLIVLWSWMSPSPLRFVFHHRHVSSSRKLNKEPYQETIMMACLDQRPEPLQTSWRVAAKLASKWEKLYSQVCGSYINARLSIAIICTMHLCTVWEGAESQCTRNQHLLSPMERRNWPNIIRIRHFLNSIFVPPSKNQDFSY